MLYIARTLADNQIYHILNKGNKKDNIFHDEEDFNKFIQLGKSMI